MKNVKLLLLVILSIIHTSCEKDEINFAAETTRIRRSERVI